MATVAAPRRRRTDLVHVTDVLVAAGLVSLDWVTDEARDKGSAVHLATELLDINDLHRPDLDPRIVGPLEQYERFKREVRPEILSIEEEVEHPALRYCGTLDRRVRINGREGVLDIKSWTVTAAVGLQLAGYSGTFDRPLRRWSLHLSADDYRLIEHVDRMDWTVFQSALNLVNWKRAHDL